MARTPNPGKESIKTDAARSRKAPPGPRAWIRSTSRHYDRMKRLEALHDITLAITSSLDSMTVLDVLLEKIAQLLPYPVSNITLYNETLERLEPVAFHNYDAEDWKRSFGRGGKGFTSLVFETRKPVAVQNLRKDTRTRDPDFARRHGFVSYLGIPLLFRGKPLGVLGFHWKEERNFTGEEIGFLETLAGHAAIAIHNSRLFDQLRAKTRQIEETHRYISALYDVASTSSKSLNLETVLREVLSKVADIFGFGATRIYLFDRQGKFLRLHTNLDRLSGLPHDEIAFPSGQGNVGWVAQTGEPLIFEDIAKDPRYRKRTLTGTNMKKNMDFLAVFPIKTKANVLGTMVCGARKPRSLTRDEINLLTAMTDQIAVAVENTRLFEQTLEKARELRALSLQMSLSEERERQRIATGLHDDIGQALALAQMKLGELEASLPPSSDAIRDVRAIVEGLIARIRSLTFEVASPLLYSMGLEPALKDLCERFEREHHIRIDFERHGPQPRLREKVRVLLYRSVKELLHNVVKHAKAQKTKIVLRRTDNRLEITVQDDGIGFDFAGTVEETFHHGGHFGLFSISEHLRELDGALAFDNGASKGTAVMMSVPLASGEESF